MNHLNSVAELDQAREGQAPGLKKAKTLAFADALTAIHMWKVWLALAWQDISIRYRRSVIGPLWITLSMAITVYSMGMLYARLFHIDLQHYFPYLVAGMLAWGLVQTILTESVDVYLISASLIRQVKLPYFFHIHRLCIRNFIISAHNLLVMIPIYLFFPQGWAWLTLMPVFCFNLLLLYLNLVLVANILGMVCARYRDMGQVFKSLLQVLFFLTPVMWDAASIGQQYQTLILCNPLYDFIQLLRQPLIGQLPALKLYAFAGLFTSLGLGINYFLFVRYRSRIVYWL